MVYPSDSADHQHGEGRPGSDPAASFYEPSLPGESGLHEAFRAAGVVFGGFIVLGIGLGILIASLGLPWWVAPVISLVVYAGSVEFLLVVLIASGAPLTTIATTTFLVNSRHLVYGLSFPLHRVQGMWGKLYSIYTLSDENFALNVGPGSHRLRSSRILWISFLLHICWVAGSTLGVLVGAGFLSDIRGIDFVMTALFIILALDSYRAHKDHPTALLALLSAGVSMVLFPDSMLTAALLLFVVLLILRYAGERTPRSGAAATGDNSVQEDHR